MSTVILTKWGNSVGIRIPAIIMKEAHLIPGEELEISTDEKGVLTLIPLKNQHAGWLEKFNAIADSDNEALCLDISNDFDTEEWTW
ncbi:MAG: AbrB/MazE/SpoVT family DNA-binding domain-containing protein [Legionellales bacterium]|nr:AbrB/MazE/SpoVT family DNA-binding domain-containing protein [Legionellales bacterium]